MNKPIYKLLDWIDPSKLDWKKLSKNPRAIDLLEKNQDKIDWKSLSKNPNAIDLLLKNQDKIDWINLSQNPNAIFLLEKNKDKINWIKLSKNYNAIHLLTENQDKINWLKLSKNPNAINLIKQNLDKCDWHYLSYNPNAIDILNDNKNKIDWDFLSGNPNGFDLILSNINEFNETEGLANTNPKIFNLAMKLYSHNDNNYPIEGYDWWILSKNPLVIDLITNNQRLINWKNISNNISIFTLDYKQMMLNFEPFYLDIIKEVMRPDRMEKNRNLYNYDEEDMFD